LSLRCRRPQPATAPAPRMRLWMGMSL
jgi:hypothetical protein